MNRNDNLERLKTEAFDLCIIGGGATGAGCAFDAALRGLKVALIEKTDFAAETSSKSTKLIHGGVRYLEMAFKNLDFGQLRQVRHGLRERHVLLKNAPHLARPLGLLTPVGSWLEGLYFTIGLKIYGWFASGDDILPKSRWLSKLETLKMMPNLNPKMHSSVLYFDGQLDDSRYCLALAQSASEAGAVLANHLQVVDFQKDANGKLEAAVVEEEFSKTKFQIRARQFLNCTGPKADTVRRLANPKSLPRIRASKGAHIVLPGKILDSETAMLIPKTPDGRVVFAIPFQGKTLIGTTDTPFSNPADEPEVEETEIQFLLETVAPFFSQKPERQSVTAVFAGLRPLIVSPEKSETKTLLRDHEVEFDQTSGLLSLLGGKWTTYRLMAKDAVDAACQKLGVSAVCQTENHLLAGAENFNFEDWRKLAARFSLPEDVSQHLMKNYGSRAENVAALVLEKPEFRERLAEGFPFIRAEAAHAFRSEMACTMEDFLFRRVRLGILDGEKAASLNSIKG